MTAFVTELGRRLWEDAKAWRRRLLFMQAFQPLQQAMARRLLAQHDELKVLAGPFQGMRYFNEVVWGPLTPKWAGTYELELHPCLATLKQQPPSHVVDVGSAEGYYAVGLALQFPRVPVHAFDLDRFSRQQLMRLAKLNGVVSQIRAEGNCSHGILEGLLKEGEPLLIVDIEGAEVELLNPEYCTSFHRTRIIVEVHHSPSLALPELSELLHDRFGSTHRIEKIESRPRTPVDGLHLSKAGWADEEIPMLLEEHRAYPQHWLWMEPKR